MATNRENCKFYEKDNCAMALRFIAMFDAGYTAEEIASAIKRPLKEVQFNYRRLTAMKEGREDVIRPIER